MLLEGRTLLTSAGFCETSRDLAGWIPRLQTTTTPCLQLLYRVMAESYCCGIVMAVLCLCQLGCDFGLSPGSLCKIRISVFLFRLARDLDIINWKGEGNFMDEDLAHA